jgi:hypothetical protein
MFPAPSFRITEEKSVSERDACKTTKKFLKLQESLNLEVDPQKKIAGVSEDVLANLSIVVEAMQADAKEYAAIFGSVAAAPAAAPPPPPAHVPVTANSDKVKTKKRRHSETEEVTTAEKPARSKSSVQVKEELVVVAEEVVEKESKSSKKKKKKTAE